MDFSAHILSFAMCNSLNFVNLASIGNFLFKMQRWIDVLIAAKKAHEQHDKHQGETGTQYDFFL